MYRYYLVLLCALYCTSSLGMICRPSSSYVKELMSDEKSIGTQHDFSSFHSSPNIFTFLKKENAIKVKENNHSDLIANEEDDNLSENENESVIEYTLTPVLDFLRAIKKENPSILFDEKWITPLEHNINQSMIYNYNPNNNRQALFQEFLNELPKINNGKKIISEESLLLSNNNSTDDDQAKNKIISLLIQRAGREKLKNSQCALSFVMVIKLMRMAMNK